MLRQTSIIVVSTTVAAFALGCGSDPAVAPKTAALSQPITPVVVRVAMPDKTGVKPNSTSPSYGMVSIDDRIMKACGDIPKMHFAFDSADIGAEASGALVALARCFTTGALAGRQMKLIGHADMRGETEYNFGLGQKRAGSVAEYLAKKGLDSGRINTSSHGEIEATGTDEDTWAQDRNVEVLLAD